MSSNSKVDDTSVRVALRVRPQSASEQIEMCRVCATVTPGHPQVILGKDKAFTFDHVFQVASKQDEIYNACVKELVDGCLDGYNATVLAYGQTGSGKTYTMGTGFDVNINPDEEGIVPRAVEHLFSGIDRRKQEAKQRNEPQPDFKVTVQFMELYNEDLIDLCEVDSRGRKNCHVKIHEDTNGNIYCMGVTLKSVKSGLDTLNCLQQGALSRTTASTNMNTCSSRSHAIFTLHIKQQRVVKTSEDDIQGTNNYEYEMLTAKFNFVDLAGSERLKRTGATGDRAKEGISINCGLLALGNVISALGDVTKRGHHIPYRDSKLTRLLQDSLGGNSRTLMIACISPSDRDFMETLNTLKYANRARNIKNKVTINQDKASKQIAILRDEITKLTMELIEFRQGKRISSCEGETDVSLENNLLKNENDKLKVRIKALASTVDSQSSRITNLMSAKAMAGLEGVKVDGGVENLIQNYLGEIEELRTKLTQTEVIAASITRNHALKSRVGYNAVSQNSRTSVLEMAKTDLARQKQRAQKLKKSSNASNKDEEEKTEDNSSGEMTSGDEEDDEEEEEDGDSDGDGEGDDSEVKENDDSSSDEKDIESESEGKIAEELAELSTEIEIKEKLVEELEISQERMHSMKTQYEEKLLLLTHKIKDTEEERDHVLKNIKEHDTGAAKQVKQLKDEYEKKLGNLKTELKKLQVAKKNHAQLVRDKTRNEQQLRIYTNELNDMKKVKARLMKQMKDEIAKNKHQEMARNKEITQLKKVSRMREIAIKNLESEKRQKEIILKRKQDEVKALRRQQKPVSGPLGARKNQVTSSQTVNGIEPLDEMEPSSAAPSGYGTYGYKGSSVYNKPYGGPPRMGLAGREKRKRVTIEQSVKIAKKKWDNIERKVGALIIQRQTISIIERDMDRWIKNRDELSRQLEECRSKYEVAQNGEKDESSVQEIKDQLEAHTLHMDYIQENIDNCQACIIEMEDPGSATTELDELISSCMLHEARTLLGHFLNNTISMGQLVSAKEASIKELEGLLEITKQHNTIQQTLLSHVLAQGKALSVENLTNGADPVTISSVSELLRVSTGSLHSGNDEGSISSGSASGARGDVKKEKARRRTGSRQDFLYPDRSKTKKSSSLASLKDEDTNGPLALVPTGATEFISTKQVSSELMQKFMELEKARKDANGNSRALNSNMTSLSQSSSTVNQSLEGDGKALVSSYQSLSASLVRGNLRSKSARSYQNTKYGSVPAISQPRSQPSSPTLPRKNQDPENDDSTQKNSENVFSRLTSNLGQDSDPDVGRMLPLRPPTGKPSSLVCTYAATGHNSAVLTLDVTEDYMFTGSKDKTVKVWDLNTGEEIMSLSGHKREVVVVRYCRLTKSLYSVSQNLIKIWDLRQESGKCIKTLSPQSASSISGFISGITSDTHINDLRISSTATSLYAAMGNTVRIWDLKTYSMTGKLGGHSGPIMSVLERRRDNDTLVFTGSRDHYVKIFELGEGSAGVQYPKYKLEPPHYDGVQCLSIRGTALFSGSRDNSIKKWDYTTHQLQQHLIGAHTDWICALDFLPKTNVLLSGCRRGVLKLWQADTCQQICEVKAHRHPINAIATNSSCVFTASTDRLVRLWRVTGTLDEQLEELRRAVPV